MTDSDRPLPDVPESRAISRKRTRLSLVWFIPIVAAVIGTWVAVTRILAEGPKITITFASAEGLEAGKTRIQYNGVQIGSVTAIRLSDDYKHVITTVEMAPRTESFLVEDTKFWVVRPRISGANVSGLSTLISGANITLEIGKSSEKKRDFIAMETPPVVTGDIPGRFFVLKTPDLGSLDNGTPIFFRRLQVGQVASYALDRDGQALTVKVFVHAPYDQYVNANTRFWHASGVDVSLSADGLKVETQSALSVLIGGIAFETAATAPVLPPAEADSAFTLFSNRAEAFKLPARFPQTFVVVFRESVRGLVPGAPVEFKGVTIGEVVEVRAQFDQKTFQFSVPVTIRVDPAAFGVRLLNVGSEMDSRAAHRKVIDAMVAKGVRAQLQSGNLLTGAKYVALDFFPKAAPAVIDWSRDTAQIPTVPGEFQAIDEKVASIIEKLDQVPFKEIGENLQKAITDLDRTLVASHEALDNANKLIEPNSVLGAELGNTLQEVSGAARSVRVLTDYLEQHPEALIRGKTEESK